MKMNGKQKSTYLNKLRTARKKIMRYVYRDIGGVSWVGLNLNTCIDIFAKHFNLNIPVGKKARVKWLFELYESGTNSFIKREDGSFYGTSEWKALRDEVLLFYGTKCMKCGSDDGDHCVDHIKPRSKYKELELVFDNMQVLCKICNLIKSDKSEFDYRPVKK